MMFGEFDLEQFRASPLIGTALFVVFMIIVPTVMLNALIAIMVRAINQRSDSTVIHSG